MDEFLDFDPPSEAQLGILVLDGSGSMNEPNPRYSGTKAEAVAEAVSGLLSRLHRSKRAPEIFVSIICYDSNNPSEVRAEPFPATDEASVSRPSLDWNPIEGHGGETPIGLALQTAEKMARNWLAEEEGELPRSVVVLLLSDGQHNHDVHPNEVLPQLLEMDRVTVATVAYAFGEAEEKYKDAMKSWASSEDYSAQTDSPDQLRNFFIRSIEASRLKG